jgi:hypothetical protein
MCSKSKLLKLWLLQCQDRDTAKPEEMKPSPIQTMWLVNSMIYFCANMCYMHFFSVSYIVLHIDHASGCSLLLNGAEESGWNHEDFLKSPTLRRGRNSLGKYNSSDTRIQLPSSTPWTDKKRRNMSEHVEDTLKTHDFRHPKCLLAKSLGHKRNQT